jgi:hypothetical protein
MELTVFLVQYVMLDAVVFVVVIMLSPLMWWSSIMPWQSFPKFPHFAKRRERGRRRIFLLFPIAPKRNEMNR